MSKNKIGQEELATTEVEDKVTIQDSFANSETTASKFLDDLMMKGLPLDVLKLPMRHRIEGLVTMPDGARIPLYELAKTSKLAFRKFKAAEDNETVYVVGLVGPVGLDGQGGLHSTMWRWRLNAARWNELKRLARKEKKE